jgi:tetratricopeptide (TPR) repeat protein
MQLSVSFVGLQPAAAWTPDQRSRPCLIHSEAGQLEDLERPPRLHRRTRAESDPAEGHYAQALIEDKRKQYDAAEQHLRRALELTPGQAGRAMDLAMFLAKHGRFNESEAMFDQAARIAPNNAKLLFERAKTYIQEQRNLDQAKRLLQRYIRAQLTPDDPPREQAEALLKKMGD